MTVARTLIDGYGREVDVKVTGAFRVGDIRHNFADLDKSRRLLGYEPRVSFGSGVGNFIRWVEGQAIAEDNYERSISELAKKGLFQQ